MAWTWCAEVRTCNLILNRRPAAPFHFPSNALLPCLLRHLTLICLKTAWLLLFQANTHILELSHLFHLFAAFFSFFLLHKQPGPASVHGLYIRDQTSQHKASAPSSRLLTTCALRRASCMCVWIVWALKWPEITSATSPEWMLELCGSLWDLGFRERVDVKSSFLPSFLPF